MLFSAVSEHRVVLLVLFFNNVLVEPELNYLPPKASGLCAMMSAVNAS